MARILQSIAEVAEGYEAIVLDQWGVLHDGSTPYAGAPAALEALRASGSRLAVLSNSGKRAAANAKRITAIGYRPDLFDVVMTSGEALWRDVASGRVAEDRFFAIERAPGDAARWADGLEIQLCPRLEDAEAILLMGLPDGQPTDAWDPVFDHAAANGLVVYCSNPDRASPRAGGDLVVSPGTLAHAHRDRGGKVVFYGKPHRPIFEAVQTALGADRILMVGDSLEHDIAGAAGAGWDSVLVQAGLYAAEFAGGEPADVLDRLLARKGSPPPTYSIEALR